MRKFKRLTIACLLFLSAISSYACEPSEYLSRRAQAATAPFEGLTLYIWKEGDAYAFTLLPANPRSIPIHRERLVSAPVFELCQIERFILEIKASESIIVYLIENPYTTNFSYINKKVLRSPEEFKEVILQLKSAAEHSHLESLSVIGDELSDREILEKFR